VSISGRNEEKSEVTASATPGVLPPDSAARKRIPLCTGMLDYFPAAYNAAACAYYEFDVDDEDEDDLVEYIVEALRERAQLAKAAVRALELLRREVGGVRANAGNFFDRYALALCAVAEVSWHGNEKHNPGQPLHHARGKSADHADCILRHLVERGGFDGPIRHSAALAWRCLALLQETLEAAGAPLARGARLPEAAP
jgi:hypothetical protein